MKERIEQERADQTFDNSAIQPDNGSFGEEDVQKRIETVQASLEQARAQSKQETAANLAQADEAISELGTAEPEEIAAVKSEIAQIGDQANLVVTEAKDRISGAGVRSSEEELPPAEQAFLKVVEVCDDFVKRNSERCKGKNFNEIKKILEDSGEELGQLNMDDFFKFAKEHPEKAVEYILSIDDSSMNYALTGELVDSIDLEMRIGRSNKGRREMLEIYEKFLQHVGDNGFSDNNIINRIKAQRRLGNFEKSIMDDSPDFSQLLEEYNDIKENDPMARDFGDYEIRSALRKKLGGHVEDLIKKGKIQEAIDLYAKIEYKTPLLPDIGKSLLDALVSEKTGGEKSGKDKADAVYYGQHQDKLLEIHQQLLKEYPEIYFNAVMKSPLELSKISRSELGAFLENIKDLSYGDKEPLLNQEVIESMCKVDKDKQERLIQVVKLLAKSPSSEIQRFKSELIAQLANSEKPEEDLEKIEAIFLRNCLPVVGKINKVFQILYKGDKFTDLIREDSSPILQKESRRGRQFQIYKDLLSIHLKSNNESLWYYLETFQEGRALFDKVDNDGVESLNQEEQKKLDYLLKRLEMLYESSWLKNKGGNVNSGETLESRWDNIKRSLLLKKGQKIVQRIEEMYLRPGGLETIEQALTLMEQSRQAAEQRGFSRAKEITEDGGAKLEPGDLLKGIGPEYLEKILQNGSVAREFLGDSAGSDATPLDTDVAMIKNQGADSSFKKTISDSVASGYGELMIVLKNRGQFFETGKGAAASNKKDGLELFFTGVAGEEHYGIRTGFPSTEIDFFVAKSTMREEELKRIYMEISRKGFYVPVVNVEGKLIFTPEMYKFLKPKDHDFSKLDPESIKKGLDDENFDPQALLDSLKPSFALEYGHDSGTWEGYSIEGHTIKVLSQFEKYFSGKNIPAGVSKRFFRMLLALHDIGKPQASDVGNKDFQHYYTRPALKKVFEHVGFMAKEIRLGETLIGDDPVGKYLQGGKIEDSAQYVLQKSAESSMTPEELLELFLIMYKVDAGSYTKDAGGQESLDHMFVFDKDNKTIEFSAETEAKIEALRNMIKHK